MVWRNISGHAKSILAANRNEVMAELELLEQAHREKFELIGTDCEAAALGAKAVQDRIDVGEGS
jgi:hypothetical protein